MYAQLVRRTCSTRKVSAFYAAVHPWALRGIAERAAGGGRPGPVAEPPPDTLDKLRAAYLEPRASWKETGNEYQPSG